MVATRLYDGDQDDFAAFGYGDAVKVGKKI